MRPSPAELARTLIAGRSPATVRLACRPGVLAVRHATDCAGRRLLLARADEPLARALLGSRPPAVVLQATDVPPTPDAPSLGRVLVGGTARAVDPGHGRAAILEYGDRRPTGTCSTSAPTRCRCRSTSRRSVSSGRARQLAGRRGAVGRCRTGRRGRLPRGRAGSGSANWSGTCSPTSTTITAIGSAPTSPAGWPRAAWPGRPPGGPAQPARLPGCAVPGDRPHRGPPAQPRPGAVRPPGRRPG